MSYYVDYINETLRPKITEEARVLDLFAGCGGLSLGFEAAGFETIGFEMVQAAADTYNRNLKGACYNTKLEVGFDYPDADIIIGGPPCQPFSVRGKQLGMQDARDGFPIFIDAVKRLNPRVFLFENVRNLAFSHKWYLDLIINSLRELGYIVEYRCLNAVDYGVPQNRERIIVVGHRSLFRFPMVEMERTTVGDAIGDTMTAVVDGCHFLTPAQDRYIAEYEKKSACINPRDLYADRPARTITCRNLAGATSDMQRVRLADGRRRRIVQREAARLQSFPDWFDFCGNEVQQFNQIGNAVPPLLAYKVALCVKETYHFATLLHAYGTKEWTKGLARFKEEKEENEELKTMLARKRELEKIPVKLPSGTEIRLSAGEHNLLQRNIVQEFLPRFGFGAEVLYIGDSTDKYLVREEEKLQTIGIFELEHEELPDIVAYCKEKNILFLIEAVHSFGQMNEIRLEKLKAKLKKCTANVVFVSAFENKKIFRRFADDIAWESEVWIADNPDHMIHFNGYKLLEIHK